MTGSRLKSSHGVTSGWPGKQNVTAKLILVRSVPNDGDILDSML
jgi:hypothetical protein